MTITIHIHGPVTVNYSRDAPTEIFLSESADDANRAHIEALNAELLGVWE